MAAKKGLGKGMGDLLGTPNANSTKAKTTTKTSEEILEKTMEMDINDVSPNKKQPRKIFDEDAIEELSESIRQYGIIEPIIVSKKTTRGKEFYQIVAGERRWRAAKNAGLKTVPVVIKEYTDKEILEIALIENIQREDLNAIEEAQAYESLIKELKITQDQLAEKMAKSRTAITNSMRLLKLADKVQQMVIAENISAGHARALLSIENQDKQYELAQKIFDEQLSVRETEKLIKQVNSPEKENKPNKNNTLADEARIAAYKEKETEIKNHLNAKVTIDDKGNKGKIVISYNSLEEFERLFELLK